ncbi:MAG TPA: VWA domain-containing protein [Acidobacteriota bacterium]|nr:VWA domain-containing protein [Acidobacteriota bacterium]
MFLVVFLAVCPLWAQAQSQDQQQPPSIDARVDAVKVDVLAVTPNGTPVKGLKKDDFRIYEEGVEQEILNFFPVEAPFSVGLVLDTSYSTVGKLGQIQDAAIHFVNALHPQDEVMVISFDDEVYFDSDFTANRDDTHRAIKSTRTGDSTQVYEAVWLALEQMERSRYRRVLVIFTDGVDTASHLTSSRDTLDKAKESNTLIYTVYFDTEMDAIRKIREYYRNPTAGPLGAPPAGSPPTVPGQSPTPTPDINPLPVPVPTPPRRRTPRDIQEEREAIERERLRYNIAQSYLKNLAKFTGGENFKARSDVSNLATVFASIAEELRSLYTLSYVSSNPERDGEFRKIEVRSERKNLRLRHREGYLAAKD